MADKKQADDEIKAKLDRLARIDEKNRIRVRRYHEKVKKAGGKQLSAIISGDAYDQLCRIRDAAQLAGQPTSFGKIIEDALACYTDFKSVDKINANGKLAADNKKIHERQNDLFLGKNE